MVRHNSESPSLERPSHCVSTRVPEVGTLLARSWPSIRWRRTARNDAPRPLLGRPSHQATTRSNQVSQREINRCGNQPRPTDGNGVVGGESQIGVKFISNIGLQAWKQNTTAKHPNSKSWDLTHVTQHPHLQNLLSVQPGVRQTTGRDFAPIPGGIWPPSCSKRPRNRRHSKRMCHLPRR